MDKYKNFLISGKIEGYSYLGLLFIAMPLKYFLELPIVVRIAGSLHGILFIWFMFEILKLLLNKSLKIKQGFLAFVLSLIPFGTFYLRKLIQN